MASTPSFIAGMVLLCMLSLAVAQCPPGYNAVKEYTFDDDPVVGDEWSRAGTALADANNGGKYLGLFTDPRGASAPFTPLNFTLSLADWSTLFTIREGDSVSFALVFDLIILGNMEGGVDDDELYVELLAQSGVDDVIENTVLLSSWCSSFAEPPGTQCWPAQCGCSVTSPGESGISTPSPAGLLGPTGLVGSGNSYNGIYDVRIELEDVENLVGLPTTIRFGDRGLEELTDEGWGLDNVLICAVLNEVDETPIVTASLSPAEIMILSVTGVVFLIVMYGVCSGRAHAIGSISNRLSWAGRAVKSGWRKLTQSFDPNLITEDPVNTTKVAAGGHAPIPATPGRQGVAYVTPAGQTLVPAGGAGGAFVDPGPAPEPPSRENIGVKKVSNGSKTGKSKRSKPSKNSKTSKNSKASKASKTGNSKKSKGSKHSRKGAVSPQKPRPGSPKKGRASPGQTRGGSPRRAGPGQQARGGSPRRAPGPQLGRASPGQTRGGGSPRRAPGGGPDKVTTVPIGKYRSVGESTVESVDSVQAPFMLNDGMKLDP